MVVFLLNGCNSLSPVGIHYTPQPNVAAVPGANQSSVHVEVLDLRFDYTLGRLEISDTLGTNATEVVLTTNDVVPVLRDAIKSELANRGFKLSDSGVLLVVDLEKFWAVLNRNSSVKHYVFEPRTFLNKAEAELTLSAQIRKSDGTTAYSKTFTGNAEKPDADLNTATAEAVLNDALKDSLAQMFADPPFADQLVNPTGNAENHPQRTMIH